MIVPGSLPGMSPAVNRVTLPCGVIRPIAARPRGLVPGEGLRVNQAFPSGPIVRSKTLAPIGYSLIRPTGRAPAVAEPRSAPIARMPIVAARKRFEVARPSPHPVECTPRGVLLVRLLAQAGGDCRGGPGDHVEVGGVVLVAVDVAAEGAVDQLEGELLRRFVGEPDDEGGGEELAQPVASWPLPAKISYFSSSTSLSSLTRSLERRKTSSNFSSARRPNLRWQ